MSNNQTQSQNTQAPTGPDNKQLNKLPLVICSVIVAAFMLLVITSFSEEEKKHDTETEKTRPTTTAKATASMVNIKEQADFVKKRKELEKKEKEDVQTVDQPISNKFEDRPNKIAPISQEQIQANKKQIDPRFEEFAQMRKNKFKEALYANTKASSYSNFKKSNSNLRPVSNSSLPANASYE